MLLLLVGAMLNDPNPAVDGLGVTTGLVTIAAPPGLTTEVTAFKLPKCICGGGLAAVGLFATFALALPPRNPNGDMPDGLLMNVAVDGLVTLRVGMASAGVRVLLLFSKRAIRFWTPAPGAYASSSTSSVGPCELVKLPCRMPNEGVWIAGVGDGAQSIDVDVSSPPVTPIPRSIPMAPTFPPNVPRVDSR
jgi:hypothetical protein